MQELESEKGGWIKGLMKFFSRGLDLLVKGYAILVYERTFSWTDSVKVGLEVGPTRRITHDRSE